MQKQNGAGEIKKENSVFFLFLLLLFFSFSISSFRLRWGAETRSETAQNAWFYRLRTGEMQNISGQNGRDEEWAVESESTQNMWNCGWQTDHFWFSPILKYTLLLSLDAVRCGAARVRDGSAEQHTIPFAVRRTSVFIHFIIMYTFKHKLGLLFAWHFAYDARTGAGDRIDLNRLEKVFSSLVFFLLLRLPLSLCLVSLVRFLSIRCFTLWSRCLNFILFA